MMSENEPHSDTKYSSRRRCINHIVFLASLSIISGIVTAEEEDDLAPLLSVDANDCSALPHEPAVLYYKKSEIGLPSSDMALVRLEEFDIQDDSTRAAISAEDYTGPVKVLTGVALASKTRNNRFLMAGSLDIAGSLSSFQIKPVPLDFLTTETIDGPLEMVALDKTGFRIAGYRYRLHQLLYVKDGDSYKRRLADVDVYYCNGVERFVTRLGRKMFLFNKQTMPFRVFLDLNDRVSEMKIKYNNEFIGRFPVNQ